MTPWLFSQIVLSGALTFPVFMQPQMNQGEAALSLDGIAGIHGPAGAFQDVVQSCHYSMKKAASFLGIGTENACFVETDGR
ncbi:hypothetical protein J1605_002958 [Eschrichtius robustus]|uniref:Uncharacterized protein n=1 Tax=Eschrichtius robustus TaxID=9764 RepID=A0AB34HRH3_ESCRO|nr:hypothetical protein J1605_002958 [Eschrichtius robustus]